MSASTYANTPVATRRDVLTDATGGWARTGLSRSNDNPHQNGTVVGTLHNGPSASMDTGIEFSVVNDRVAFEALEDEWNSLFERSGNSHQVFQTFGWCWHWCNHFLGAGFKNAATPEVRQTGDGDELYILTARLDGALVSVWPMVRRRVLGVAQLTWLGAPVSQYGDVVIDDAVDAQALIKACWAHVLAHANVDIVQLWKVRGDSIFAKFLATSGAEITGRLIAPYLSLGGDETVDAYLKSKPRARNRKRIRRALESSGDVSFDVIGPGTTAQDVSTLALELKRGWLEERGLFSRALNDTRTDSFFHDVTGGQEQSVGTRTSTLSVDGRVVAIEIGFPCKGSLAMHVIVYDHTYNKSGCGALAMEDSIRACWDDGFTTFDLLAPGDSYKLDWADGSIDVNDWACPVTLKGRAWMLLYVKLGKYSKNAVKRFLDKMPVGIRQTATHVLNAVLGRAKT